MQDQTRLAAAIAVSAMFTLMGLAGTALADKDEGKVHKEDNKHQYVNLGVLGDVGIYCDLLPPSTGDVTVSDGSRDGTITLVPDTPINIPGINSENLCLGGAIGEYNPFDSRSSWDVWIHDYMWNGCDAYTIPAQDGLCPVQPQMGWGIEGAAEFALETATGQGWTVELKSAGLARTQTEYDRPAVTKDPGSDANDCTPVPPNTDPESGPRVCVQIEGRQSAIRNSNTFGFCGQGSINAGSGMVDPFDVSSGPDAGSATNVTVTKQVFTDSVLFYLLDCPLVDGVTATLKPFYDLVAGIVNSVTCPVPVVVINLLCVFDLPAVGSGCYTDKLENNAPVSNTINIGVVAIVGEIGWTHEETNTCKDTPIHDDWIASDAGLVLAFKGVEPPLCVSAFWIAAGVRLTAVFCPPAICTFKRPIAFLKEHVDCREPGACEPKGVNTLAWVVPRFSLEGDTAEAEVYCGTPHNKPADFIVGSYAAVTADKAGAIDLDGPVLKTSRTYWCHMKFEAVQGMNPYLGIAMCYDQV